MRRHRPCPIAALLLAALFLPVTTVAQMPDLRLPISLDADSTDYDGKSSMLMFRGLKLSQGPMGVQADEGRASKLDFEDSVWRFAGNVVIDVEGGHIECSTADLTFTNHQLTLAVIDGDPATFELTRPGTNETTYAEASRLRYDLASATIEFSGNALINEGGNQISADFLAYNIAEQRINAVSSGESDDKVRIRYTPPPAADTTPTAGDEPAASEPGTGIDEDAGNEERTGDDAGDDAGDERPVDGDPDDEPPADSNPTRDESPADSGVAHP